MKIQDLTDTQLDGWVAKAQRAVVASEFGDEVEEGL
jgi:hypothetical protein